jgi:hypothetical protein
MCTHIHVYIYGCNQYTKLNIGIFHLHILLSMSIFAYVCIVIDREWNVCMYAFIFCVHYLCLIGRVYVFYVGHVDRVVYMKPFPTVILEVNIIIIYLNVYEYISIGKWINVE